MSEQTEVKDLISQVQSSIKNNSESVNKQFGEFRSELEAVKGKMDGLDNEKFDRATDEITKKLESIQSDQMKLKAAVNRNSHGLELPENHEEHKAYTDEFIRKGTIDGVEPRGREMTIMTKAMSTDINPQGGYLVRPELANFVADRVFETSPLRGVARVVQIGTKALDILLDDDEAAATWTNEGSASSNTATPDVGIITITAHKLDAEPRTTQEQLEDSYLDVESWLQAKLADKFSRTENTAFVAGDGNNKPKGFLSYAASADADVYERDAIGQVNLGGASDVTADGLIDMKSRLKERYQVRATWGCKRASFANVLKLSGADNYFFSQTLLRDGQEQPLLLGKPVVFMDDLEAIAANALSFVYADFSVAYTIVDRVGLSILRDPYSNKGFITYYTTKRVGGAVTNFDAIKIGKIAA